MQDVGRLSQVFTLHFKKLSESLSFETNKHVDSDIYSGVLTATLSYKKTFNGLHAPPSGKGPHLQRTTVSPVSTAGRARVC